MPIRLARFGGDPWASGRRRRRRSALSGPWSSKLAKHEPFVGKLGQAGEWGAALVIALIASASAHAQTSPVEMNVMLCDSPEHAIAYTVAINEGAPDDLAKDIVGRAARAEVCDKFIGHASVDERKTLLDKGQAYIVTSYSFKGVGALKWSAIPKDQE